MQLSIAPLIQRLRCALRHAFEAHITWQAERLAGPIVFCAMPTPIETQAAPPAPAWQALPGLAIELGSTGYQIRLNLGQATPRLPSRYTLINPEGLIECWGVNLAAIKLHAESLVRDRAEFVCEAKGWTP